MGQEEESSIVEDWETVQLRVWASMHVRDQAAVQVRDRVAVWVKGQAAMWVKDQVAAGQARVISTQPLLANWLLMAKSIRVKGPQILWQAMALPTSGSLEDYQQDSWNSSIGWIQPGDHKFDTPVLTKTSFFCSLIKTTLDN